MSQITATAIAYQGDRSTLSASDRQIIAAVLTWDCATPVNPQEVETIAISHDIVWVKLTDNRAVPIHVESFRAIHRQQQGVTPVEAAPDANNIEVDSDGNSPNPTYRVWLGMVIIGTFYQSPVDGKWLIFTKYGHDYNRYHTADDATAAIVTAWHRAQAMRDADPALKLVA